MDIKYIFESAKMIPSDINEHLDKIYQEASNHNSICEFGTCTGISTIALLKAIVEAKEMGIHKTVQSYDISFHEGAQNLDYLAVQNGVANLFSMIIENVLEIPPVQCDLLFLDTIHNYNQIKQELKIHVENNPNPPKTIIFHDVESYDYIEETPLAEKGGIVPAILEFLSRNHQWYIDYYVRNCNGLMIIKRSLDKPNDAAYNHVSVKEQIKIKDFKIEYNTPDQKIEQLNSCAEKIANILQFNNPNATYKVEPCFVFNKFSLFTSNSSNHFKVFRDDAFVEYIEI